MGNCVSSKDGKENRTDLEGGNRRYVKHADTFPLEKLDQEVLNTREFLREKIQEIKEGKTSIAKRYHRHSLNERPCPEEEMQITKDLYDYGNMVT